MSLDRADLHRSSYPRGRRRGPTAQVRALATSPPPFRYDRRVPASVSASYRLVDSGRQHAMRADPRPATASAEAVETIVTLKTMEGLPLPARVFDAFFDSAATGSGKSAKVQGALTLKPGRARPTGRPSSPGDLIDIDLKTLFERRFPRHRMTGLAHVAIKSGPLGRTGPGRGSAGPRRRGGAERPARGRSGSSCSNHSAAEMRFRMSSKPDQRSSTPTWPFNARSDLTFDLSLRGRHPPRRRRSNRPVRARTTCWWRPTTGRWSRLRTGSGERPRAPQDPLPRDAPTPSPP